MKIAVFNARDDKNWNSIILEVDDSRLCDLLRPVLIGPLKKNMTLARGKWDDGFTLIVQDDEDYETVKAALQ